MYRNLFFVVFSALALSAVGLASGAYAQSPEIDPRTKGAANCRVEAPKAWNDIGHITWIGHCKNGYADGLGVLRRVDPGSPADLFLGRVDQGFLRSGALDLKGGYEAGRWKGGAVPPNEWQTQEEDMSYQNAVFQAYRDAEKAAEITSKVMARHSNPKTARFYTRIARVLRMQLDD